MDTLFQDVTGD